MSIEEELLKHGKLPSYSRKEKMNEALGNIEEATFLKEEEAKRLGISIDEYEKSHGKREPFNPLPSKMRDYINKWQEQSESKDLFKNDHLSPNLQFLDKTIFHISQSFILYALVAARTKMRNSFQYEGDGSNALDNISDVFKVEVDSIKNYRNKEEELYFRVYTERKDMFVGGKRMFITFRINDQGDIFELQKTSSN